eukprot:78508-Lingulodinium_polyedra.AAC.1
MPIHGIQFLSVSEQRRWDGFRAEAHRALPPRRLMAVLDVEVDVRLVPCAHAHLGANSRRHTLG